MRGWLRPGERASVGKVALAGHKNDNCVHLENQDTCDAKLSDRTPKPCRHPARGRASRADPKNTAALKAHIAASSNPPRTQRVTCYTLGHGKTKVLHMCLHGMQAGQLRCACESQHIRMTACACPPTLGNEAMQNAN